MLQDLFNIFFIRILFYQKWIIFIPSNLLSIFLPSRCIAYDMGLKEELSAFTEQIIIMCLFPLVECVDENAHVPVCIFYLIVCIGGRNKKKTWGACSKCLLLCQNDYVMGCKCQDFITKRHHIHTLVHTFHMYTTMKQI